MLQGWYFAILKNLHLVDDTTFCMAMLLSMIISQEWNSIFLLILLLNAKISNLDEYMIMD
jgi:hypothetical protein